MVSQSLDEWRSEADTVLDTRGTEEDDCYLGDREHRVKAPVHECPVGAPGRTPWANPIAVVATADAS